MKRRHPSRLALALFDRFVPGSDPLVGDLIEEFHRRPSNIRLWRQLLAALAAAWLDRDRDIRPLKLLDEQPADAVERTRRFRQQFPPVNPSGSPLPEVGGLGLVALGVIVALALRGSAAAL